MVKLFSQLMAIRRKRPGVAAPDLVSGQVMLLTTFTIAATFIVAVTLAGLLTVYQLRQASDLTLSAQAIYAADAGIDWGLYQFFKPTSVSLPDTGPIFSSNEATVNVICLDALSEQVLCTDPTMATIRATGVSGGTTRRLELILVP